MDRNFGFALALSFGVFILWFGVIVPTVWPPPPPQDPAVAGQEDPGKIGPDGKPAEKPAGEQAGGAGAGAVKPADPAAGNGGVGAGDPAPVKTFAFARTAEQPHAEFRLQNDIITVLCTSTGGGVHSVTLNEHAAEVGRPDRLALVRTFQTRVAGPTLDGPPLVEAFAPLRLKLDGEYSVSASGDDLAALEWEVVDGDASDHSVAFAFAMGNGLRIVRRYTVVPALPAGTPPPPEPANGITRAIEQHRLQVDVTLENFDTTKLRYVQWEMAGPAGIQREKGQQAIPYGLAGWTHEGADQELSVQPAGLEGGETPHTLSEGQSLRYVGVANPYFTAALVPINAKPSAIALMAIRPAREIAQLQSDTPLIKAADLLRRSASEVGVVVRHESTVPKATAADAPGRLAQSYHLLVGAKEFSLLGPLNLDDLRQKGFFDRISYPMLLILKGLRWITGSWGAGVILLTLIVRLLLHYPQRKAQISMHEYGQKMKLIQPELKKIKEIKDVQRQRQEQMKLMQKHKVKPPLGCLMMLAQIPVFISVYQVFLYSVELRHAGFLFIGDLSQPDHLIPLGAGFGPIPLPCCSSLGVIEHINLIPILWIILMQLNHKFSVTKIEDMTEQQQQQMKMMRYMTPLFGLMFWNIASAAGLYVIISTTWGMIESKFIRREIARREELANAGIAAGDDAVFEDKSIKKPKKKK